MGTRSGDMYDLAFENAISNDHILTTLGDTKEFYGINI